ncbi:dihydroorotase [Caulobacter vibrioides]|uniref:Aspartate transcarbamoylase, pyrC' subunit n=2 Tax=Caulobacter vibrioides TaxID=155892 RepID=Q9A5K3_CAUVC|nr:dihydroorotase [Caulobacter vibrioides]YP_002517899.1 dihydroorotase [Caulobacter vibrioides NA1000]AAK24415.1 aspartate transcarbamoylase, pyrC' subunit [Caulobacter vibrioides CB15]ACL95991.1 dihydroorotase [Caulobacter vibrioides NA1000]ATC29297.1 dihydroorotase [Caulobacter vibrioides]QXZ50809.1 dihydroorotase [Caulobacter vibrioides]
MNAPQPLAFVNARLVDPESGYDGPGGVIVSEGVITDVAKGREFGKLSKAVRVVDCGGALLAPGLIDLRVRTGEPGAETKETLASAAKAAAAGGVTSFVVQPDTAPAIDDPSMVDFILRRARDVDSARILVAGAATKALLGEQMAEIGLMREAGCVYVTDAGKPIVDSKVMQRVLTYAKGFDTLLAHRPMDPWLGKGGAAIGGEFAGRMGLPSISPMAERIMLERDVALLEATGGRLLVDQISSAQALETLARAKGKGLRINASVSINHLSFNELDIGDYRTFAKLNPPLRGEDDRQALIEALASGLIDIVVSSHSPAPAEDKRLPFDEAAPGAVGLETLLPALLSLYHEERLPLLDLIRAVTLAPAQLLGLRGGRLAPGAPADLVLCDIDAPIIVDAARLLSKSKNSPFDGRRLQGQVLMTVVDGRVVHRAEG